MTTLYSLYCTSLQEGRTVSRMLRIWVEQMRWYQHKAILVEL